MNKILVFGGTTEGRILAQRLEQSGCEIIVCVATEYGKETLWESEHIQVHTGRMDCQEMMAFFQKNQIELVIDATHPYAKEVTREIKLACKETKIPVIRCLRAEETLSKDEEQALKLCTIHVSSAEEAAEWLKHKKGRIFLTTGSKELAAFTRIPDYENRIYARVLPLPSVLEACKTRGLKGRHVIGAQGPFSVKMNLAMIQEYDCQILVTKDGGKEGGFLEKLKAAALAEIPALIIDRPKEETGMSVEEVMNWYERRNQK